MLKHGHNKPQPYDLMNVNETKEIATYQITDLRQLPDQPQQGRRINVCDFPQKHPVIHQLVDQRVKVNSRGPNMLSKTNLLLDYRYGTVQTLIAIHL